MLNDLQLYYLQAMGIDVWISRKKNESAQKTESFHELCHPCEGRDDSNRATKLLILGAISSQSQTLFNNMMQSIALDEKDFACIAISEWSPSLAEKIALIQPTCLLVFSTDIAQSLLQKSVSVGNKLHHYQTIPLIVSYDPDYLLQHPKEKKQAWQNLLMLQSLLQIS